MKNIKGRVVAFVSFQIFTVSKKYKENDYKGQNNLSKCQFFRRAIAVKSYIWSFGIKGIRIIDIKEYG